MLPFLEEFCLKEKIEYKKNESMKEHTTFRIGGPADFFIKVDSLCKLTLLIKELSKTKTPYFVIGKGANLLVSDKGIEGVVISLSGLNGITVEGDTLIAEGGATLSTVCTKAAECSLSGLEFAYGIPASVGGALYMNAGAYGGEMSQAVVWAEYIDECGELKTVKNEEMNLGYRTSIFKGKNYIITKVAFKLKAAKTDEIKATMEELYSKRRSKQPLEFGSAGSTFKRPEGYFAGALIEQSGLKGERIGDAEVSEKHAGFIINRGNATARDVKELMQKVTDTVLEKHGVRLEPEVIIIGKE